MIQRLRPFFLLVLAACGLISKCCYCQELAQGDAIQEIKAALQAIDPYLPSGEINGEVDIFGSTSMDTMAHGWATGFKKFHPKSQVVISAEGSESVFKRLAANPTSVGMLSRPVTEADLEILKQSGLKKPVAVMVGREALGVFVNNENPLEEINFEQLVAIFCSDLPLNDLTWGSAGVSGALADQPIQLFSRNENSGTHSYIETYVFSGLKQREASKAFSSNAQVVQAVAKSPASIAICGIKCGGHEAKALHLREREFVVPDDDHAILVGRYPLVRPLTLVVDIGQTSEEAKASQEFVRYALTQAGQMQTILCGFFPFDPPFLRAEYLKLIEAKPELH